MDFDLKNLTPDVRYLNDMREVVFDKDWFALADKNTELYYMYRGLKEENGIRYDITVIPPMMMGQEFVKTKGHYHIGKYQEVYAVLGGQAIYLLQKRKENTENEIEDVYAVRCQKGDVVIIPPDYGHVTINPSSDRELKMANWISRDCQSDYYQFEKMQGACYYYIESPSSPTGSSGSARWTKNPKYQSAPELRFEEPLKSAPESLDFLKA